LNGALSQLRLKKNLPKNEYMISLCIISRKEDEKSLRNAIWSCSDSVDEIIVIDTGKSPIKDVVDNFALQLEEKKGKAELLLNAQNDLINVDEVHFANTVNNLMDNALKYSKDNVPPCIKLTTQSTAKNFIMRIEDNGIGMTRETVKRVFERFYRAHTGNVHNVKGFGLGLSYVETMVEAHGGNIKADSVLGKGSAFTVELPLKKS